MRIALKNVILSGTLLAGIGISASALAETDPIFGQAKVVKTLVTENKAIVGKGSTADYYGFYGNYYNNLAGYYGNLGMYYKSYSYYYSAYSYANSAASNYYAAYYYQYYGL